MGTFDIMSFSNDSSQTPPYTPINQGGVPGATNDMGPALPADPVSSAPPAGLEGSSGAVTSAPRISTLQSIWGSIKSDAGSAVRYVEGGLGSAYDGATDLADSAVSAVEGGVESVYTGGKAVVSTVYGDAKSAVSTVVGDVASPIASTLKSTFWYVILGVAAVGALLYFTGKSGIIGQAASVR